MDRFTIYFFLTIPLYFLLLHFVILPLLQKFSRRVQGAPFTYRLQGRPTEEEPPAHARYDLPWSFLANAIALCLSLVPFGIVEELGLGAEWFGG